MRSRCFRSGCVRQILEEIERGCVQPLQIVEKQRQRMFGSSEDAKHAPEHEPEPPLRVARRQLGCKAGCGPMRSSSSGSMPTMSATVRAQRLQVARPATSPARRRPCQAEIEPGSDRLAPGRIRNVALQLVELAGREQDTPRGASARQQLMDQSRLAHSGLAHDQDQFRRPARRQCDRRRQAKSRPRALAHTASRASTAVGESRSPERKRIDAALALPIGRGIAASRVRGQRLSGVAPPPSWP